MIKVPDKLREDIEDVHVLIENYADEGYISGPCAAVMARLATILNSIVDTFEVKH